MRGSNEGEPFWVVVETPSEAKWMPKLLNDTVAAHLRGMWPAPSTDRDILTPNEKLKTLNTTIQTHN